MIEFICADATQVEVPSGFDFQLTDPPYSAWVHANTVSSTPRDTKFDVRAKEYRYDSLQTPIIEKVAEIAAAVSGWSLTFTDTKSIHLWHDAFRRHGAKWRSDMIWKRWSSPVPGNLKPPHTYELVVGCRQDCFWNGPGDFLGFDAKCLRGEHKHDGEKPLDLALEAMLYFSDAGDLGIDPCGGVATFALAAWILGRDFVSYELDPRTHDVGQVRLTQARDGVFARKDLTRMSRFLMKHPECADQVFSKVPKDLLRVELDVIVREQTKLTKDAVIRVLTDDALGGKVYEKLVKEIYK